MDVPATCGRRRHTPLPSALGADGRGRSPLGQTEASGPPQAGTWNSLGIAAFGSLTDAWQPYFQGYHAFFCGISLGQFP